MTISANAMSQHRLLDSAKVGAACEEHWQSKRLADLTDDKITDFAIPREGTR
jgi:hypothetical protein